MRYTRRRQPALPRRTPACRPNPQHPSPSASAASVPSGGRWRGAPPPPGGPAPPPAPPPGGAPAQRGGGGTGVGFLGEPLRVCEGSAKAGAAGFPANVNVAAALGLAGIGPEQTRLEIWADPTLTRETHRIEVVADSAAFRMTIENGPSEGTPPT